MLIPCVGLSVIAGGEVDDHRRVADEAGTLVTDVDRAALALDAHIAATQEYRLVELARQARNYGISPADAGALLGFDLDGELEAVRHRLAGNELMPVLVEQVGGLARLLRARRAVDAGEPHDAVFPDLARAAGDAWEREVERLADRNEGRSLSGELRGALQMLQASAALFQASYDQLRLTSELAVPGSTTRGGSSAELDLAAARYQVALEQVDASAHEHLQPAVDAIAADEAFARAADDLGLSDGRSADVPTLAAVFRTGLERDHKIEQLTTAASADARVHAAKVGATADDRYRSTLVFTFALLAATIGLAVLVARSISIPLRRLARRAAEVSDGELDGDPLRHEGPRETAVLAATLNDAVQNLRAVEAQMGALANADVAAATHASAPGKLGALVGRSVEELARSISERDGLHRRLAHEAAYDSLTGLANRRTAMASIDAMLGEAPLVGLLFIDLDGFKLVNDEWGHAVGDRVLRRVADNLQEAAPAGALLARLGGDEFVIGLPVSSEHAAVVLAEALAGRFARDISVGGVIHSASLSVGVAVSRPGDDADRLLRSADAALHAAKRGERGSVVALDDVLRSRLEAEHRLAGDLRQALAAQELEVHYQPIFRVDGPLHGVEALVRWRGVDGGFVPPDRFIPAAEGSGLILDVDAWVLERSLAQVASWRAGPFPDLHVSVNMSAKTLLSSRLVGDVERALRVAGLDSDALTLEVTETALLHDLERAATQVAQLRALGVRTSVDDFGTGYTSVSHLRRLPVAELKIDASFIQAMGEDVRDHALADLIARIGDVLALDVVAEGVETDAQLEGVRALGCDFAQGFLLGRPVAAADFEAALAPAVPPAV